MLSVHDSVEVVGEADNGALALEAIANLAPDVVLMDIRMPVLDGVAATKQITAKFPRCKVIILTTFDDGKLKSITLIPSRPPAAKGGQFVRFVAMV